MKINDTVLWVVTVENHIELDSIYMVLIGYFMLSRDLFDNDWEMWVAFEEGG